MSTLDPNRFNDLLAQLRAKKAAEKAAAVEYTKSLEINPLTGDPVGYSPIEPGDIYSPPTEISTEPGPSTGHQILDRYGNLITLNSKQSEFVTLAGSGKSAVLIGAAGTGKTTCQKAVVQELELSGRAGILQSSGHKHLTSGTPGIVICAYTRRAVANIRKNVPENLQGNCITIHKLLEYQPVYYEVTDPETGKERTTMRFEATRNAANPLPSSINCIIFEESSMLGTDLHQEVIDACPHNPQIIYLGDIQQLPPVFGPAILGFKLLELPVVELTEVYRQALESPIISLAHRILSGNPMEGKEFESWKRPGQMTIRPWKKKIDSLNALLTLSSVFTTFLDNGLYDPEEDMILLPFNKACGTDELNKKIGNYLAKKSGSLVYQIVAGFNRLYFREGEKVLVDKEDATIIRIEQNPAYYGVPALPASPTLDYWGYDSSSDSPKTAAETTDDDVDFLLGQVAMSENKEDRVRSASHIITVRMNDSDQELTLSAAGELNSMMYGYCLTVHKAQGSEWRRVFLCLHQSHNVMLSRELLYTAITRAREELYIMCEPDSLEKGIKTQRVKGNTLEEKAEFFKGKQKGM
jgi:exodeoxyribonuclease V alpha subunit